MNILLAFQKPIIDLKTHSGHGGVDLAREDRIAKADSCVDAFYQLSLSKSFIKCVKRGEEIAEVSNKLYGYL
jgi:hypothetical protein